MQGTYFVWTLAPFLVQLASYITFVLLGGTLDANKAFVSAALFNILRFPMAMCKLLISPPPHPSIEFLFFCCLQFQ